MNRTARTARREALTVALLTALGVATLFGLSVASGALDQTTHTPSTLPACATEDALGPCRWDATEQGNGTGRSFTIHSDGRVEYDA